MVSLRGLVPRIRAGAVDLLSWATSQGWRYRVASTRRTYRSQAWLWRNYLRNRARDPQGEGVRYYPALPPGHSMHQLGRAFDLDARPEVLRALGERWEQMGGRWGGRGTDPIHFEA
jgi:LAS superfamily LD-carboxypeptidase LdcB